MSIEMQTAMDGDMAVINEDGTKEYVDNAVFDVSSEVTPVNQIEESVVTKVPNMTVENKQEEINFDDFDPMSM